MVRRLSVKNSTASLVGDNFQSDVAKLATRPTFTALNFTAFRGNKERRLLSKGLDRTWKELEIDRVLRTQMQVRVALKTLFTKAERFLIRNNKAFVLHSDTSSSDSSDDGRKD